MLFITMGLPYGFPDTIKPPYTAVSAVDGSRGANFWASLEHQMHYKKDAPFTEEMEQELLACAEMSAALDERMDALRKKASETF